MRLTTLKALLPRTVVAIVALAPLIAVPVAALPPASISDFRHALSGGGTSLLQSLNQSPHPIAPAAAAKVGRGTSVGSPQPPNLDVLINDPTLDTPEGTTQSEPTLAVNGSTICAGYNNTRGGPLPNPLSGLARSTDRGSTWTDRGTTGRFRFSDPVLAVHRVSRTFYYADIAFKGSAPIIGVARSTDECATFPALVNASPSAIADQMQDKPWIAVDNSGGSHDGNVYACWTRFGGDDSLHFSRSTDGATTFVDEQVIAPPTDLSPFGCHVDVGPNGEVYVAWSDRNNDFPIHFRRSLDGGLTWDPVVQVNTATIRHPGIDRMVHCEEGLVRPSLNGDIRMLPQAWMAVDTTRLGTDDTDFAAAALASKTLGPVTTHVNLGISLLGNSGPSIGNSFKAGGQDDLFIYGIALASKPLGATADGAITLRLLGEVAGQAGSHYNNDLSDIRFGLQMIRGAGMLYVGVSTGLVSGSEDIGASFGFNYAFDAASLFKSDDS